TELLACVSRKLPPGKIDEESETLKKRRGFHFNGYIREFVRIDLSLRTVDNPCNLSRPSCKIRPVDAVHYRFRWCRELNPAAIDIIAAEAEELALGHLYKAHFGAFDGAARDLP